jgi:hypothetical protein
MHCSMNPTPVECELFTFNACPTTPRILNLQHNSDRTVFAVAFGR